MEDLKWAIQNGDLDKVKDLCNSAVRQVRVALFSEPKASTYEYVVIFDSEVSLREEIIRILTPKHCYVFPSGVFMI